MIKRWLLWLTFVALSFAPAFADTGGSMGGGNWSSGGGGGGAYSDPNYRNNWNHESGEAGTQSTGFLIVFVIAVVLFVIFMVYKVRKANRRDLERDAVDVSVLRVAVDARARKFVQTELARIAKVADTATDDGRSVMLREVAVMLRKLRDAWVYGGAVNEPLRSMLAARTVFTAHVDDARARFMEETIRNEQGKTTTRAASEYTPRSDEGQGLILVSIIIAARHELFTVNRVEDGDDLRRALEVASQLTPNRLVALEVVWQPSEENDRLSSLKLEAKYPRPQLVPIAGALVGKTFCTYCGGPYPAELVSCPHCGAPNQGKAAA